MSAHMVKRQINIDDPKRAKLGFIDKDRIVTWIPLHGPKRERYINFHVGRTQPFRLLLSAPPKSRLVTVELQVLPRKLK